MKSSALPLFLPDIKFNGKLSCCKEYEKEGLLDHQRGRHSFSWNRLAWAIQKHVDPKCIERYLGSYDQSVMQNELLDSTSPASEDGNMFPILYFAAERNSREIVNMLCYRGANIGARAQPSGLPLLAYTIMSAEYNLSDTTDTVVALLSMGAIPNDIPRDMWCDYVARPKNADPKDSLAKNVGEEWCTAEIRDALCRTLNLMQRYFLWKAERTERPTSRKKQVAHAHNMMPLFELPYRIIGQTTATKQVEEAVASRLLYSTTQPLVLLFTGPSGHGKTELASSLGHLLSLPILTVDCSVLHHSTDLLGMHAGYEGWQQGSPLSAHLAQHAGARNVIFLDEFDKTTEDVRQSLLLLFEGKYTDRRNNKSLDCSKSIWVLAVNLGVPAMIKFWDDHLKDRSQGQQDKAPFKELNGLLRQIVKREFGSPLARRLTDIVPFLPFNEGEQAVATYKFMRTLWQEVRKPINVESNDLLRNIFLDFVDDGQIAKHLAAEHYDPQEGASQLHNAVGREIRGRLTRAWYRGKGIIVNETIEQPLAKYDVSVVTTSKDDNEVAVRCVGTCRLQLRPEVL